jgi:hypothetical protein
MSENLILPPFMFTNVFPGYRGLQYVQRKICLSSHFDFLQMSEIPILPPWLACEFPQHMFGCLDNLIGGPNLKKKDKESFDDLHHCLKRDAEQQSERDFPRMLIQNEITDGTKMCGSEKVGNCFVLLFV